MAAALKEWAVVVRALLGGEQLLDVRKGGLREEGRHFALPHTRFFLYPTVEHQQPELVRPAYRRWIDEDADTPGEGPVTVTGWAEVEGVVTITDPEDLAKLASKLIWTGDYVESRLRWKRRDPLWVLALRAYNLEEPAVVAWRDEYRGCTSWMDLAGLPDDPATLASEPALSDESFTARRGLIERELGRGFEAPER